VSKYLLQRLATIVPTLFFVSVLIFGLQQLLPGDPAIALAGEDRDPNVVAHRQRLIEVELGAQVRNDVRVAVLARERDRRVAG